MKQHLTVIIFMTIAVLFKFGGPVVITIAELKPTELPFPQSDAAFYACIAVTVVYMVPGYWVARVERFIKKRKRLHLTGDNLKRLLGIKKAVNDD